MIRSSKHSLKFSNSNKRNEIKVFIQQYRDMVKKYINILWNEYLQNPPTMLDNKICQLIKTNIAHDSRIRQCAAKQACSMIKAIVSKQNKRLYKLKQLQKEGKDTQYLQRKIDTFILTKPQFGKINVELDSRFIDVQDGNSFDLFIQIKQIGDKQNIRIPIKHTFTSNKWKQLGQLKNSIRINENYLTLYFEVEAKEKHNGILVGADQGLLTCLSLSDGQTTPKNKDGYDLAKIISILSRRVKGSKGFRKAQSHRKNYIHWSLNQLNWSKIGTIRLEQIKDIRKGKNSGRNLSHWTYTLIKDKLIRLSEDKGFVFIEQDNKFRSQRCSQCGWTHKSNRKGKTFKCLNCEFVADSDLNAASNHETDLIDLPQSIWYKHINRSIGFYWLKDKVVYGQECIVPDVQRG